MKDYCDSCSSKIRLQRDGVTSRWCPICEEYKLDTELVTYDKSISNFLNTKASKMTEAEVQKILDKHRDPSDQLPCWPIELIIADAAESEVYLTKAQAEQVREKLNAVYLETHEVTWLSLAEAAIEVIEIN